MYCSKCGKLVTEDMKFCNSCGEIIDALNKAENIIPTATGNVVTKKSPVKKKVIFITMAAVVIVGLLITYFITNPPISGPEVLYDLEWGMTCDQVKAVDSQIRQQEFSVNYDENLSVEKYGALSTIDYDYMHISSKVSGAVISYYFGTSNSLEKIEIQYGAGAIKYDVIMKKLTKYYDAVCKVSPTKGTAEHGENEVLTWNTANNKISVGGDFDSTDYVTVIITPAQ